MEEARLDVRALGAATLEDGASDDAADAAAAALDFLWGPEENERAGARRVVASAPPGHDYRENNVSFAVRGRPDQARGAVGLAERVCNVPIAQSRRGGVGTCRFRVGSSAGGHWWSRDGRGPRSRAAPFLTPPRVPRRAFQQRSPDR